MSNVVPKLVFFDLETAGLNPKCHPILQIAAIAVDDRLHFIEAFEAKIRFDERHANRNSLRKNHYHRGIWARAALEPEEAAKGFADFLRRHATFPVVGSDGSEYRVAQLVAHNAPFDGEFIQTWYQRRYLYLPARFQVLCTLQRAMWFFEEHPNEPRPADFKLATLCRHFGVPFHAASAHEALADVTATVALYRELSKQPWFSSNSEASRSFESGDQANASLLAVGENTSLEALTGSNGR